MKVFNVKSLAEDAEGEYVLGLRDLETHAVYLIYGFLLPGEGGRKLRPGRGHEEILCVVQGEVIVQAPRETRSLKSGEAIHLREDDEFYLENKGGKTAYYVLAGGHPLEHHS